MVQFDALCAVFDDAVCREFGSLQLVVLASAGAVFSCFLITSLYLYIFTSLHLCSNYHSMTVVLNEGVVY